MAKIPDIGELSERVTLQKYDLSVRTRYGDRAEEGWEDVCTVWAKVANVGSREFWEAQSAHAELSHSVTIRYRPGVTADMRIIWGTRKLDVVAPPVELGRRAFLVLKCREVTT